MRVHPVSGVLDIFHGSQIQWMQQCSCHCKPVWLPLRTYTGATLLTWSGWHNTAISTTTTPGFTFKHQSHLPLWCAKNSNPTASSGAARHRTKRAKLNSIGHFPESCEYFSKGERSAKRYITKTTNRQIINNFQQGVEHPFPPRRIQRATFGTSLATPLFLHQKFTTAIRHC